MKKLRVVIEGALLLCLLLLAVDVFVVRLKAQEDHLEPYVVTIACPVAPEPIMARSRLWALIQGTKGATVWTHEEWKDAYMTCLRSSDEPHNCGHLYPQFKPEDYRQGK